MFLILHSIQHQINSSMDPKGAKLFSWFLKSNWSIDDGSFNIINNKYGPFSVDRFANNLNKKINKFNSKYFCPETSHANAFTNDWSRDHNWLCPPISCIGSVLRHLTLCKARGVLLVRIWPSSYYWSLIYPDGDRMANFVKQYIVIEPLYSAEVRESVFNGYPKLKTLVLNILFYSWRL